MEPNSSASDQAFLEELRRHRAELRESISVLEDALAAPATADQARWAQRVHVALVEVPGDFHQHIDIAEGPNGLYYDLLKTSPRLSDAVATLTREHELIRTAPDAIEDAARVRGLGTALLGRLIQHRQRGSDLLFEAYEFDIGGET
jgi:hypothetical protein